MTQRRVLVGRFMVGEVEENISNICNIWNDFITNSCYLQKRIGIKENIDLNYFGDLIKYFYDTSEILKIDKLNKDTYYDNFSNAISFLQSIYVQQDLIEELLTIFKCKSNRSILDSDVNYKINRDIRNELVGHPINKKDPNNKKDSNIKGRIKSSAIFTNNQQTSNISYLLYKRENNFLAEIKEYSREEILERHKKFTETYTSEVYKNGKKILREFREQLQGFQNTIQRADFNGMLRRLKFIYGHFFEISLLYDVESIFEIYSKRNLHYRYEFLITSFYLDLKESITDMLNKIDAYLLNDNKVTNFNSSVICFKLIKPTNSKKKNYKYELEKLFERNKYSIEIINLIEKEHKSNEKICNELNYMGLNINNKSEYYSSLNYLKHLLNNL